MFISVISNSWVIVLQFSIVYGSVEMFFFKIANDCNIHFGAASLYQKN